MAPLVRTGGSRHTGLAAPPHRNIQTGERGKELLSCVPYYANHPLVQEAVKELEKLEEQQKRQKKPGMER